MIEYLERVGIRRFRDLADANAEDLQHRLNTSLGRADINAAGLRALKKLIDALRAETLRRVKSPR